MDEINRLVGGLISSVETLTRTWAEQDRKATDGRRELYRKVEELRTEITKMWERLGQVSKELTEIKPAVRSLEDGGHRTAGAKSVIGLIWTMLVAGIGAIAYVVHDWVALILPAKH